MIQIENINKIEYFKNIFEELKKYGLDVSFYCSRLEQMVLEYETKKIEIKKAEQGCLESKIKLSWCSDQELNLFSNLTALEMDLRYYILFLDLCHLTNDWDIEFDLDVVFYDISHNLDEFLGSFCKIDIQKLILKKYHDLLLKKILKDYLNGDQTYLNKYDELRKYIYLQNSIKDYVRSSEISLMVGDLSNYGLRDIIDKLVKDKKIELEVEPLDEFVSEENKTQDLQVTFFSSIKNKVNMLIKYKNSFGKDENEFESNGTEWLGDGPDTQKIIDRVGMERIIKKDLSSCNLCGYDLSMVDFTGVLLMKTNLMGTHARIDPQRVGKYCGTFNMSGTDLSDCYVIDDFAGYPEHYMPCLKHATLLNNFEEIDECLKKEIEKKRCKDLQEKLKWLGDAKKEVVFRIGVAKALEKDLSFSDLRGIPLGTVDFCDVSVRCANLENTGAKIDPLTIRDELIGTCLKGCYVVDTRYFKYDNCLKLEGVIWVKDLLEAELLSEPEQLMWLGNSNFSIIEKSLDKYLGDSYVEREWIRSGISSIRDLK